MLFDVEVVTSPTPISVKTTPVPSQYDAPFPARPLPTSKVGYLMPWGSGRGAVGRRDAAGHPHSQRRRRLHAYGRRYPIGTAFIRNSENAADLNARLAALAVKHGAELVIDSTWVDEGTSLGSNDVAALKTPKILLVWDAPTQSLSAGWTRYTLERRFGAAVTAVRTSSLGRANFNDYDVIVMPSGNYAGQINEASSIASRIGCAAAARWSQSRRLLDGRLDRASACWIRRLS